MTAVPPSFFRTALPLGAFLPYLGRIVEAALFFPELASMRERLKPLFHFSRRGVPAPPVLLIAAAAMSASELPARARGR